MVEFREKLSENQKNTVTLMRVIVELFICPKQKTQLACQYNCSNKDRSLLNFSLCNLYPSHTFLLDTLQA